MIGTYVLSAGYYDAYFTKAQKVRTLIKRDFAEAFEQVRPDPDPDRAVGGVRARREDERPAGDVSERRVRGAGEPGRASGDVGAGRGRCAGLPLGLHLIGRELDEQGVLNAGLAIEERAGFTARAEKWW